MAEEQKAGRSISEDAPGPGTSEEATSPACSCRMWWKVAAVVLLTAAVAGMIASKTGRDAFSTRGPVPADQQRQAGSSALPAAQPAMIPVQERGEAQGALSADNPLDRALQSGRPVVADFGRGLCIPCKMMKPILDDLKKQYAGRAEILIIEIDEYPAVTQRVGIRAIPTQIFYDAEGKEAYRHQGFMSREDIVSRLVAMGVK